MRTLRSAQRAVATLMLSVAILLLLAASAFSLFSLRHPIPVTFGTQVGLAIWAPCLSAYPLVGWLIARRDPENRMGWLFLWVGSIAGFHLSTTAYSTLATRVYGWPLGVEATWVGNWGWVGWIGVIATLVAPLFPDGRPVARWVWALIALVVVGLVAGGTSEALAPGPLDVDPRVMNPFASDSAVVGALSGGLFSIPLGVALGVVSLIVRYRRADETTRLQLRWFIFAVAIVGIGFALILTAPPTEFEASRPLITRILEDAVTGGWSLIAVAVGVAVLRYRLYAIENVINRALVYTTITVVLGATYLLMVVVLQAVLAPVTGGGDIAVAVSTLLVAALFRPVRRRVQSAVDRRFYRSRYDARVLLEGFAARLRRQIDLDGVVSEMDATVRRAVHPTSVSLWVRPR